MAEARKQTVLVTGSSGCLGQHIVKLLHEKDDTVGEIRCYDIKPYQNNLRKCAFFVASEKSKRNCRQASNSSHTAFAAVSDDLARLIALQQYTHTNTHTD